MPYRIKQWWTYKTQTEKILIILLALAIFIIIVLASLMKHNVQKKVPETCNSLPCLTETVKIMRLTNSKIDPCDDFYQFTCGNFSTNSNEEENLSFLEIQTNQLIGVCEEQVNSSEHAIVKLIKKFFQKCVNTNGLKLNSKKIVVDVVAAAGGWPALEGTSWREENFDWKNASYKFRELGYMDDFFININVDHNVDDNSNYTLEVLVADVYDYHYGILNIDKSQIMTEVAVLFGAKDTPQVANELSEAHNLQQALQALVYYKYNEEHPHHKYTISEYQKLCNSINWLDFINNILGPQMQVTGDQVALFPPPEVFKKWFDILLSTPKRPQANYIMWKFAEKILPYLSPELQYFKLGLQKRQGRKELCLETIMNMGLLHPTQIMLHRKYVTDGKKKKLQVVLDNLKNQLVQNLNRSALFNPANRTKVLDTIQAVKIECVPDEDYFNNEVLDKLVVESINPDNASFLELLSQAVKNKRTQEFLRLKNPNTFVSRSRLFLPNYDADKNTLAIPGLLTNKMYFDEKRPNYINYGIVGTLLQHAFRALLEKNVGTNQTTIAVGKCTSVNVLQDEQSFVASSLSIAQQISYGAYQDWVRKNVKELPLANIQHTPNQLFWIASVSTFCKPESFHGLYKKSLLNPKEYISRAIRNSQRFAKDFNCSIGSAMNPIIKCGHS